MRDIVETPLGDQEVVEVNWGRDTILTEDPVTGLVLEWKTEEIEEIAPPDISDPDAVERWLRIKAIIVPSLEIETETIRCMDASCLCGHCYRIVKKLSGRGIVGRVEIAHHVDNETCQCDSGGTAARTHNPFGTDCTCMTSVNLRWVAPQ